MEVINPKAAGIDVGSRSHFVAIGQAAEQVKEFGVYNEDLHALTQWLLHNKIISVAMESTGTYWQTLFSTLQQAGLQVILCNGKFTKNIKRPLQSKSNPQYVNEGKRGLIFADKGRAKNQ